MRLCVLSLPVLLGDMSWALVGCHGRYDQCYLKWMWTKAADQACKTCKAGKAGKAGEACNTSTRGGGGMDAVGTAGALLLSLLLPAQPQNFVFGFYF